MRRVGGEGLRAAGALRCARRFGATHACRDTHKALASELELTPISKDFSTFYQIIPIISYSLICGLCSTNVRGVMMMLCDVGITSSHHRAQAIVFIKPFMTTGHTHLMALPQKTLSSPTAAKQNNPSASNSSMNPNLLTQVLVRI